MLGVRVPSGVPKQKVILSDDLLFWVSAAEGRLHPSEIKMLGGNEFRLRQGFRLWRKRLYAAKAAPARRPVVWCFYTFSRFQNIDFNRPIQNKRTSALQMSFYFGFRRPKGGSSLWVFHARGGGAAPVPRFSPAVKTFVRRTRAAAQKGRSSAMVPSIQNIDFNRPFQNKRACCKIEF